MKQDEAELRDFLQEKLPVDRYTSENRCSRTGSVRQRRVDPAGRWTIEALVRADRIHCCCMDLLMRGGRLSFAGDDSAGTSAETRAFWGAQRQRPIQRPEELRLWGSIQGRLGCANVWYTVKGKPCPCVDRNLGVPDHTVQSASSAGSRRRLSRVGNCPGATLPIDSKHLRSKRL